MRCQLSSESIIVADYVFARFYEDLGRPGVLLDRQRPRRNRDAPTQRDNAKLTQSARKRKQSDLGTQYRRRARPHPSLRNKVTWDARGSVSGRNL